MLIEYLKKAASAGYMVVLSSHGDPNSNFSKLAFGSIVDVSRSVDRWNVLTGATILNSATTEWYSCNYTYGSRKPDVIFSQSAEPYIRRFFNQK